MVVDADLVVVHERYFFGDDVHTDVGLHQVGVDVVGVGGVAVLILAVIVLAVILFTVLVVPAFL